MRISRILLGTMLWLLSVVSVVALAWFAIDSAGQRVGGSPSLWTGDSTGKASPAPTGTGRSLGTAVPGPSVRPSPTGSGSSRPRPSDTVERLTESAPAHGAAPRATDRPSPPGSDTPTPGEAPVKSWTSSFEAGKVTIFCRDSTVVDWRMVPADGWRVSGYQWGTSLVADFTRGDVRQVVAGRCRAGTAAFERVV